MSPYKRSFDPSLPLSTVISGLWDTRDLLSKLALNSVLLASSLGFTSIALLYTSGNSALAQVTIMVTKPEPNQKIIPSVNLLYVNPDLGNDKTGNGSTLAPWKTISQALQIAAPSTVIMLSPGTYSPQTGEIFPLMLKSGVSIQGDTTNKGKNTIIRGGGEYLSRSFGGENVTIVGANLAGLRGVTVTNPNPRGYGLWIESSNPMVEENTFIGSTQDGITVTGNATPTISKNYFQSNGANGITIAGYSQPDIRENIFQQTGFGINIAQNAAPIITGNQIQYNRSGVVVQAHAHPILRRNLIFGNREDGLVVIDQALPDLGRNNEPGGNEFRDNARYDINAIAAKQMISAAGNKLHSQQLMGKVDINGVENAVLPNSSPEDPINEVTFSANKSPETPQLNYLQINSNAVEFTAPPQPTSNQVALSSTHYRVLVQVHSDRERNLVRSLVPGAFSTQWQGHQVIQAGAFSNQSYARDMVNLLNSQGLKAIIDSRN